MKGSIEHSHLGHALHNFHASFNAKQVGRIVQGCDFAASLDALQYLARNQHTIGKAFTAVHYTMAHRIYL